MTEKRLGDQVAELTARVDALAREVAELRAQAPTAPTLTTSRTSASKSK